MSKALQVRLTAEDRKTLEKINRGGKERARVINRAKILLQLDANGPRPRKQSEIVKALGVSIATVSKTGRRYAKAGLADALGERPRPSKKEPKITGEIEARLVLLACSDPPTGRARWTVRLLANEMVRLEIVKSVSHTAVAKRLKKMKLSLGA